MRCVRCGEIAEQHPGSDWFLLGRSDHTDGWEAGWALYRTADQMVRCLRRDHLFVAQKEGIAP